VKNVPTGLARVLCSGLEAEVDLDGDSDAGCVQGDAIIIG